MIYECSINCSSQIHARSLFPSQDTPAIKSTYSAKVKSILPVLMSGLRQSPPPEQTLEPGQEVEYTYDQVSFVGTLTIWVGKNVPCGSSGRSLIYF